jgi:hypothetical protein
MLHIEAFYGGCLELSVAATGSGTSPLEEPVPAGARHVALGVWASDPVSQEAGRLSLDCVDPSGHSLELTHRAEAPA